MNSLPELSEYSRRALAEGRAGSPVTPAAVELDDGATVLDAVEAMLSRFVAFPTEHARVAVTLWVIHTHALDAFETTPRLALLSPEPGSGKTRVLEILELLCLRPLLTVNVTPAYLFRKVADEAGPPTLLYDEIDTVFGPKARDNEDIRGMLNAGYRRGATAGRCVIRGKTVEVEELPAFAACALAGLDDLPDTIMSRSIVVRMRRRAPDEQVESYRRRVHAEDGHTLRDRVAEWAGSVWEQLDGAWPTLPPGIEDRNADVWEPLLAIAEAAGGDWPDRARRSAVAHVADARGNARGFGVQLLADLRVVFGQEDFLTTETILTALHALEESPWADLRGKPLDARGLSKRLGKYEVRPQQQRLGDRNQRGYQRGHLLDAWVRYLPTTDDDVAADGGGNPSDVAPPPRGGNKETLHSGQSQEDAEEDAGSPRLLPPGRATSATPLQPPPVIGTWRRSGEPVIGR